MFLIILLTIFINAIDAGVVSQRNASWPLDRVSHLTLSQPIDYTYVYPDEVIHNVTVYILDSGIRLDHEEFDGRASVLRVFADDYQGNFLVWITISSSIV